MRTANRWVFAVCLSLCACTGNEDVDPPDPDISGVAKCFDNGDSLAEANLINNNVAVEHGEITDIIIGSTGQIAVASTDGAIKLWSTRDGSGSTLGVANYDTAFGSGNPIVRALAYSVDGTRIVSVSDAGVVALWDATIGAGLNELTFGEFPGAAVAISEDATKVAVADESYAGNLTVWSPADGTSIGPLETRLWFAHAVMFLPGSQALVTAGDEYGTPMVEIRDPAEPATVTGTWLAPFEAGTVVDLALSPDGERLVAVGTGYVAVLDLTSMADEEPAAVITQIPDHDPVSVTTTPNGDYFVTVGSEGTLRVWDLATATQLQSDELVGAIAGDLEASGELLVTAESGGVIRVLSCP